jgi:hypothetical protein
MRPPLRATSARRSPGVLPSRRRSGVIVLALALVLAGCGSGDAKPATSKAIDSDPVAWVGAFCGGLGDVLAGVASIAKSQPTPQGQKDGLLAFSDSAQRAFANTAGKLEQLGPPRITDGKRAHDTAVSFFTKAAGTVADQRAKFAALDANDPDFVQKASRLSGPDLSGVSAQAQELTSNKELLPAFRAAPECQRLGSGAGPR